jgi:hypothetical protein
VSEERRFSTRPIPVASLTPDILADFVANRALTDAGRRQLAGDRPTSKRQDRGERSRGWGGPGAESRTTISLTDEERAVSARNISCAEQCSAGAAATGIRLTRGNWLQLEQQLARVIARHRPRLCAAEDEGVVVNWSWTG